MGKLYITDSLDFLTVLQKHLQYSYGKHMLQVDVLTETEVSKLVKETEECETIFDLRLQKLDKEFLERVSNTLGIKLTFSSSPHLAALRLICKTSNFGTDDKILVVTDLHSGVSNEANYYLITFLM